MNKLLAFLFVFALAVSCLASGTSAQTVQGVITGTVRSKLVSTVSN